MHNNAYKISGDKKTVIGKQFWSSMGASAQRASWVLIQQWIDTPDLVGPGISQPQAEDKSGVEMGSLPRIWDIREGMAST